jgi:phage repressor protein C with HTH and peptisase S24 domain
MATTRVRKLRLEAAPDLSAAEFARAHGLTEPTFRSADNGNRPLTRNAAKQYAKLFTKLLGRPIDWIWLFEGENRQPKFATVSGWTGAGDVIMPFETDPGLGPIAAPPDLKEPACTIVHGTSMVPVYRNDDMLFFDLADGGKDLPFGEDCMVETLDGTRLIKGLRKSKKRNHVRLYSYETDEEGDDVQIKWAAPVRWVKRA